MTKRKIDGAHTGALENILSCAGNAALLGVLASLLSLGVRAETPATIAPQSPAGLAFARYIASLQEREPFTDSDAVGVIIEASLPGLYKETWFLAVRTTGESERSEYHVLRIEGDAIVAQELIARYLLAQRRLENLSFSAIAINPSNYKFRYKGEVGTGGSAAYVYQIKPKKKRDGLIQGQLWIDSVTGAEMLRAGRMVKPPAPFPERVEIVRETAYLDGMPSAQITHMTLKTPQAGRGDLTITEIPLSQDETDGPKAAPLESSFGGLRKPSVSLSFQKPSLGN